MVASRRHRENYELAYLAGAAGRGRGLMSRAISLLCDALFAAGVGTTRDPDASGTMRRRSGSPSGAASVREGIERRSIWLHGRREDAIVWSLLPDDAR